MCMCQFVRVSVCLCVFVYENVYACVRFCVCVWPNAMKMTERRHSQKFVDFFFKINFCCHIWNKHTVFPDLASR
jgi:hypothetical protein